MWVYTLLRISPKVAQNFWFGRRTALIEDTRIFILQFDIFENLKRNVKKDFER